MKTAATLLLASCATATVAATLMAASPAVPDATSVTSPVFVSERGPNHKTWSRLVQSWDRNGNPVLHTNRAYVELASGMHFKDAPDGPWRESSEEIVPAPGGATARQGQHKAWFPQDIVDGVDLTLPDGRHVVSRVLGLMYYDESSSNSVLLSEVKSSAGQITGHTVTYVDALTDVAGDISYDYTRAGLEQNIILRAEPRPPAEYGLNPATTHLQVISEFLGGLKPLEQVPVHPARSTDPNLDFGSMALVQGAAFALGQADAHKIPVRKRWRTFEGRELLFEDVPLSRLKKALDALKGTPGASYQLQPRHAKAAKYEVGLAKDLRAASHLYTEANHVPQTAQAVSLIGDYNLANKAGNEVAIRLSVSEHTAVSAAQAARPYVPASARELLAQDIRILRNNTEAPNPALQKLVEMNKRLHPVDFTKQP